MLNIIYPTVCGFCKRIYKNEVCPKCNKKLQDLNQTNIETNGAKKFDELAYMFKYEGTIRKTLIEYKFYEYGYLYNCFSKILLNNEKIVNFIKNYDIIIPVPIHKNRKRKRGYNQTELIAKKLCLELGLKLETNVIEKSINTKPQSLLRGKDRIDNAKNVYKLKKPEQIKGKNILILDDIYTTGNTVNECSKELRKSNPNKIGVLVIAKD